jgi:hypothetical protein
MSDRQSRLQRMLRLRAIEHRVAKARAATAETKVSNLIQIDGRLAGLRAGLSTGDGETSGLVLQSLSEMARRLDKARASMVDPISEAARRRDECHAGRIRAQQKQDSMTKLHDREAMSATILSERRADANRPRPKTFSFLEDS